MIIPKVAIKHKSYDTKLNVTLQDFKKKLNELVTFLDDPTFTRLNLGTNAIQTTSKAKAYLSGHQLDITDNTWTKVLLDSESYDPGDNFANYKFTARVAGFYLVLAQIKLQQDGLVADKSYSGAIRVNGGVNELALSQINTSTTPDYPTIPVFGIIPLDAGDYLELWFRQNSGGDTIDIRGVTEDLTFMEVHLLST